MPEVLIVQKRKTTRRFRYWMYLCVLVATLGIITVVVVLNFTNEFEPLVYADTLSSDGVVQQVGVDNKGYSVIREGLDGDYQSCEYQLTDIEVVAIQQALSDMEEYFVYKKDAPDLEPGVYRVFYGDQVVIISDDSTEEQQDLVDSIYGPLRGNCIVKQ